MQPFYFLMTLLSATAMALPAEEHRSNGLAERQVRISLFRRCQG
jgi:hypothetical protein